MTKKEAIGYCISGIKVKHNSFSNNEYIVCYNNHLYDEDNLELDWNEFWAYRDTIFFDDGWSLYEK